MNTVTAADSVLTIRRTFNASRERVFAALTSDKQLSKWFGPPGSRVHSVQFDARLGGSYKTSMTSSGGELFEVVGTISEFEPPALVAYTFRWLEDDPALEFESFVRFELTERGDATEMIFTQHGFATEESRDRHDAGWTAVFDKLTTLAESQRAFTVTGMDLSGYMCKDGAVTIAFYRDVLGFEPSMVYPDNRGAEFELPDGTTFGLWGGGGKVMPFQPSNGIMFAVDDFDAAVADMKTRGIAIDYQTETPVCFIAMISDPDGNKITFHKRK